ncbi:MAG: hypothetical protein ACTH2Q_00525 [Propionibacteriaceae bacterium]
MFFQLDENGSTQPMSREMLHALATSAFDDEPESLAAEYLDWRLGSRIEWLRFVSRFSAAIFVYRATGVVVAGRVRTAEEELNERGGWPADWRGEMEDVLTERIGFLEDSVRIAASSAILAATAAIELLITELADEPRPSKGGLHRRLEKLLESLEHGPDDAGHILTIAGGVRDLRNSLAHQLDGSDWTEAQARPDLTPDGVERAFRDVGQLAMALNALVEPGEHERDHDLLTGFPNGAAPTAPEGKSRG